jgi:DNA processing protein
MNVNTLTFDSPLFPAVLKHISTPPAQLYIAGDSFTSLLQRPCVAIVGSRSMTPYGKAVTMRFAAALARAGVVIVSGLALGTDSVAHRAALEAGGATIAVLPSDICHVYPARHQQLAQAIIDQGGALVSEHTANPHPRPYDFIGRNRLISGLSSITLITEAAAKSGTLHTAAFALEQGRDVMAVPGNITSPTAAGTNALIQAGALVATDVSDVYQALGLHPTQTKTAPKGDTPEQQIILDLVGSGTHEGRSLLALSQLPVHIFDQNLTMLEIAGTLKNTGNNYWTII